MRKSLTVVAVLVLLCLPALTMVAGGQGGSGGRVEISFWKYQDENEQKTLEGLVEKFNSQYPEIKVNFEVVPWEQYLGEKVPASLVAGVGPDVFWLSAGEFMKYVANELILPLNDTFTEKLTADFLPQALRAVTVGENIYGVPHEMGVQSLIYDQALFEANGVTAPYTWDALVATARKLKTPSRWGIMIPTNPDVYQNFIWYSWLWMAGGEVVDAEWERARIDEPAGVKALQFWGDLINQGLASPKGGAPFDADVALGKAAMSLHGHWVVDNFKANYPEFTMGVSPLPPVAKGKPSIAAYGGWWSVVNKASEHPQEAKRFAVWLFGDDPQNAVDLLMPPGTYLSPRKSVMQIVKDTEYYKQDPHPQFIEEIWPNTRPEPAYPPEIVQAVTDALQAVMFGGVSGKEAASAAASRINAYLASEDGVKIRMILE
jgi:multiple sugar transport system substrate-binding protein